MQARDTWIGWSDEHRRCNLQRIVNNGRFLILPWVHVKGLASKILALSARQLPLDWAAHYGYRPLLLETLVDSARFRGTCYRAPNWTCVGQTTGRGRMDQELKAHGRPVKDIYVIPSSAMSATGYAVISRGKQMRLAKLVQVSSIGHIPHVNASGRKRLSSPSSDLGIHAVSLFDL